MGKSKDLATGASYVDTSGDTMTGNLLLGSNSIGLGTTSPDEKLHVEGSILVDAFNAGNETGIFFREGFTSSNKYNHSILAYDTDGSPDGISINGYGGVSICTGSNSRQERFKVDNSGRMTVPNQPSFMVIMTSGPTVTGTSVTTLPWNSEIFDVGNNFNTSTYTFTAPVAGKYYMHLHLEFHSDSSWTSSTWSYVGDFYVNGVQKTGADFWGHSGRYNICPNTAILNLGANDQVNVRARANNNTLRYSGDSANAFSNCKWMGYLIG